MPGSNLSPNVSEGYEVPLSYRGDQQYVLVDYCCFHLTSGASTAVGPYIIPRNMKRFFLSQPTLQDEFVEKKYQVFDIVGSLIILVQVNLSSPVERV